MQWIELDGKTGVKEGSVFHETLINLDHVRVVQKGYGTILKIFINGDKHPVNIEFETVESRDGVYQYFKNIITNTQYKVYSK